MIPLKQHEWEKFILVAQAMLNVCGAGDRSGECEKWMRQWLWHLNLDVENPYVNGITEGDFGMYVLVGDSNDEPVDLEFYYRKSRLYITTNDLLGHPKDIAKATMIWP